MSASRIKTLFFIGLLIGSLGVSFAATFPAGDDVAIKDGVTVESPQGTEVKVWGETNMTMEDMFRGTNNREVHVTTEDGNITIASSSDVHGEVFPGQNLTGTWTNVSRIQAGGNWLEIYPVDKQRVDVRGDTDDIQIRSMTVDDGQTDFVINGTNGGTGTVRIYGLPQGQTIAAIDKDSDAVLDSNTTTTNGVLWLDIGLSSHTVQLQSGDGLPQLSNPQPEGTQSTTPSTLSIDVNDTDFPNDEIDVTFYLDGTQVGTDTLTSNGTASVSISPSPGAHTVSANATDSYGQYAVQNWTFGVPNTLYLRNETQPSQKVQTPTNVSFYERDGDYIFSRDTSDGTIDLSGLNTTEFIVTARPQGDGWTNRTVYIPDIAEVSTIYLLNQTEFDTVENRFVLNDPTATYSSESLLIISRDINNTFTRIVADEFGAEGVTAVLQQGTRHRLRVRNNDGDTQSIGPYRADVSETVGVVPGEPTIPLEGDGTGIESNAVISNQTIEYRYNDTEGETGKVTLWIYERNNKSNQLVPNKTFFNLGEFSGQESLTANESEQTWVVAFVIERNNEEQIKRYTLSNRPDILPPLADEWLWIPAVLALFLIAGSFSVLNVAVGSVITSLVGGIFWWIGLLDGPASAAGVALAIFLSVMYHMYSTSGP